jgi:hypothetical protein
MKCVALIFLMMFTWSKQVVAGPTTWTTGTVVLNTEQVLNAEIAVAAKHDLVLMKVGDRVEVLPAHRIKAIYYYDPQQKINRKFISLSTSSLARQQWKLYEVVLNGDLPVLRRLKSIASKSESVTDDFEYFVYNHQEMVNLKRFRARVYPELVAAKGSLLTHYVKSNRLNPNNEASAIRIVEHFNQLVNDDVVASR